MAPRAEQGGVKIWLRGSHFSFSDIWQTLTNFICFFFFGRDKPSLSLTKLLCNTYWTDSKENSLKLPTERVPDWRIIFFRATLTVGIFFRLLFSMNEILSENRDLVWQEKNKNKNTSTLERIFRACQLITKKWKKLFKFFLTGISG